MTYRSQASGDHAGTHNSASELHHQEHAWERVHSIRQAPVREADRIKCSCCCRNTVAHCQAKSRCETATGLAQCKANAGGA
jgi:hypothetical protein